MCIYQPASIKFNDSTLCVKLLCCLHDSVYYTTQMNERSATLCARDNFDLSGLHIVNTSMVVILLALSYAERIALWSDTGFHRFLPDSGFLSASYVAVSKAKVAENLHIVFSILY